MDKLNLLLVKKKQQWGECKMHEFICSLLSGIPADLDAAVPAPVVFRAQRGSRGSRAFVRSGGLTRTASYVIVLRDPFAAGRIEFPWL